MPSQDDMECFVTEAAAYNFLYDKTSKEYKNTEMMTCVYNIIMNIGVTENKSVVSKKNCVQCAAFSGFSQGKPVMWNHIEKNRNGKKKG